jgi:hypothetical protein
MTVLHSGSTKKFAEGWAAIFTGAKRKPAAGTKTKNVAKGSAKASPKKKPVTKKKAKR